MEHGVSGAAQKDERQMPNPRQQRRTAEKTSCPRCNKSGIVLQQAAHCSCPASHSLCTKGVQQYPQRELRGEGKKIVQEKQKKPRSVFNELMCDQPGAQKVNKEMADRRPGKSFLFSHNVPLSK